MTTISNFMSTLATPASLVGSFVRTALVLTAASFVVWDDRWAFTNVADHATYVAAGSARRSIFEPRLSVVRSRQPVKGERLAQLLVRCIKAGSPNAQNQAGQKARV